MSDRILPGAKFELASFGELVGDPSRVAILLSLMDGRVRPASELASIAGVTPATASSHLARLVKGGLLVVEPMGRHRYYRLADERVADALEAVALLRPARHAREPVDEDRRALVEARTCYRHLAGRLGVSLLRALEKKRFVGSRHGAVVLTARGTAFFEEAGLMLAQWPPGKPCLDWTERRYHLGGPLGGVLTGHLFELRWLARRPHDRAVRVTASGERELLRHFAVRAPAAPP